VSLMLPEPASVTLTQVCSELVPRVQAIREVIRQRGDIDAARELARRLEAFRRYVTDRKARLMLAAETRRTELLIGELLGPPTPGTRTDLNPSPASERSIPREDRHRFRVLAAHATEVEAALTLGVVSRKALLERIAYPAEPGGAARPADGRCPTLVADPPWRYGNTATRASASGHYHGTLTVAQLCGEEPLPGGPNLVQDIVAPKAATPGHLYLWTTAGHLSAAFDVMAAWGYEYKTYLVWVKKTADGRPQMGLGNYFRVSTELVLFGVRGGLRTRDRGLLNWFDAQRGQHSAKPHVFHDLVMRASPGPYFELFARCGDGAGTQLPGTCQCSRCRLGWQIWGNQA
jgi:N6-adenosine-specific RNA methylase IME4